PRVTACAPDPQTFPHRPRRAPPVADLVLVRRLSTLALKRPIIYRISMQTLHVETTCTENGVIILRDLPIHEGDSVEVVVIPRSSAASVQERYPLRGEPVVCSGPFATAAT